MNQKEVDILRPPVPPFLPTPPDLVVVAIVVVLRIMLGTVLR